VTSPDFGNSPVFSVGYAAVWQSREARASGGENLPFEMDFLVE
jgi:hypothetical protein